jgi:hypothetical protein
MMRHARLLVIVDRLMISRVWRVLMCRRSDVDEKPSPTSRQEAVSVAKTVDVFIMLDDGKS